MCQVPGLFEGDEYTTLMTQCKEGSQRDGLMLDSAEELYKWFTQQVRVGWGAVGGRGRERDVRKGERLRVRGMHPGVCV